MAYLNHIFTPSLTSRRKLPTGAAQRTGTSVELITNYIQHFRQRNDANGHAIHSSADSGLAPSQWETALLCNDVFNCLGANLKSDLHSLGLASISDQQPNVDKNIFLEVFSHFLKHWDRNKMALCRRYIQAHFIDFFVFKKAYICTFGCYFGLIFIYAILKKCNLSFPSLMVDILLQNETLITPTINNSSNLDETFSNEFPSYKMLYLSTISLQFRSEGLGERWRHQMETFSALLALCVGNSSMTGEFPSQRPVTRSFDALFDLRLE